MRYALRTLIRTPAFSAAVVLTLALGIGANAAVFSAVDAVLLRPLPFPSGDRLVRLWQTQERSAETNIAPVRLEEWNRLNSTFEAITGYYVEDVSETTATLPERIKRAWVAPRFVEVWRISPRFGRGFTEAEHLEGGPSAVLISDRYRRRRFGDAENVVGRLVRIGTASFPIVGVMPPSFRFPDREVDLWFPIPLTGRLAQFRTATWYRGIGRLKPEVTLEQARANLAAVQAQLGAQHPDPDSKIGVEVAFLKDVAVGGMRGSLWLLFGAVSVLLLIACTNIAALLLCRAAHRRHEISVRVALGATRASIAAQTLTETALLAVAGGAVGLLASALAARGLRSLAAPLPRVDEISVDGRVLLYTAATTLVVALLCALLPAMRAAGGDAAGLSRHASRTTTSTRHAIQWLLVGAQVALSVVLLAGAGLLVRSLLELSRVEPGFDADRVLTFRISGDWSETGNHERLTGRIDATIDRLRTLPGVAAAATALFLPGVPAQYEATFDLVEAQRDSERRIVAENRVVSPEYFATMRVPVIAGELCGRRRPGQTSAAMVNRTFADRYLSARASATGLHLDAGNPFSGPLRIAGVVGDARERGLDRDPGAIVYTCMSAPTPVPFFMVRTHAEPEALAQSVRLTIHEIDPARAVYDIARLEDRLGEAFTQNRLQAMILAAFAMAALLLACVGLYGTSSYVVMLRRREIAVRLALGSTPPAVVRAVVFSSVRVAAAGCACGAALSMAFARVLSGMLFGVSASDPATLAGVVALVLAVTAIAALLPAARAAGIEPMRILQDG